MERKHYTSLSQLRDELEKKPGVQILSFTGSGLIVNDNGSKIRYGLCGGVISQREHDESVGWW